MKAMAPMASMDRRVQGQLDAWKTSPARKPLVIFGARQVGKTYAIKQFAARQFDSLVYLDFSRDVDAAALFDRSLAPKDLVPALELYTHVRIAPEQTLIVFDEVQFCERALTSLKYFCEDAPQYHVVAAGSLLGVRIKREAYSFPVGKVDMLQMHPLSFEEYLWAVGERPLAEAIQEAFDQGDKSFVLHDRALKLVRDYELVGGMPEPVSAYVRAGASGLSALKAARAKQVEINTAYAADVVKYADQADAPRIIAALNSVPRQLAKENHKFQYKVIRSGARATQYENAVDWLDAAGVVARCTKVTDAVAPLKTFEDPSSFKLYMADTGLLAAQYDALPQDVEPASDKASAFRGGLAENYVYQQLCAANATAYYWGTASRAEIEFVARTKAGDVLPLEVKSGKNVSAKSLNAFVRAYHPRYTVRVSVRNFGVEGGIKNVPLYAAWCLGEMLQ